MDNWACVHGDAWDTGSEMLIWKGFFFFSAQEMLETRETPFSQIPDSCIQISPKSLHQSLFNGRIGFVVFVSDVG